MAVPQELTDALAKIDSATNSVAAFVTALKDKISTSMTADDVAVVKGNLDAVAERLTGIAADPNTPVPEPQPLTFSRSRKG